MNGVIVLDAMTVTSKTNRQRQSGLTNILHVTLTLHVTRYTKLTKEQERFCLIGCVV